MATPPEIGSPAHARMIFRIYARYGEAPPSNYHLQTTDQAEWRATVAVFPVIERPAGPDHFRHQVTTAGAAPQKLEYRNACHNANIDA